MTTEEREVAILSLRPQVEIHSKRFAKKIPSHPHHSLNYEDYVSVAWLGAIEAVDHFDPSRGVKLSSYADKIIRGRLLDFVRSTDSISRKDRRGVNQGLAEDVQFIPDSELINLGHQCPELHRAEVRCTVQSLLRKIALSRQHIDILTAIYWKDATAVELAKKFGVHESRIAQLKADALRLLGQPKVKRMIDGHRMAALMQAYKDGKCTGKGVAAVLGVSQVWAEKLIAKHGAVRHPRKTNLTTNVVSV